jgi:hypothetical protein
MTSEWPPRHPGPVNGCCLEVNDVGQGSCGRWRRRAGPARPGYCRSPSGRRRSSAGAPANGPHVAERGGELGFARQLRHGLVGPGSDTWVAAAAIDPSCRQPASSGRRFSPSAYGQGHGSVGARRCVEPDDRRCGRARRRGSAVDYWSGKYLGWCDCWPASLARNHRIVSFGYPSNGKDARNGPLA